MKRAFALILSLLFVLCLFAACGEKAPEQPSSEEATQNSQSAPAPSSPESAPSEGSGTASAESTASEESETSNSEESSNTPAPAVTMDFDPKPYQDPGDDDRLNVLAYASNSGSKPAMVKIRYKAFDLEGNALSVYEMFRGTSREEYVSTVYVPAKSEKFPVAFALPTGFKYNYEKQEDMPEIDHIDFEVLEIGEADVEDLRDHFTAGEPEIRENHIYIYVKFDSEIGDNYASLYPNYTLLGYSGDTVTTISCITYFPGGTSSFSVGYAKKNNDSSLLVYHHIPIEPIDRWELYLGCIAAEK